MLSEASPHVQDLIRRDYAVAEEAERDFRTATAAGEGIAADWQLGKGDAADLLGLATLTRDAQASLCEQIFELEDVITRTPARSLAGAAVKLHRLTDPTPACRRTPGA